MALQKQKVQLNISNGIDTKSDSPSVLATSFTEAENVNFGKLGGAQKRLGNASLSTDILSGGNISSGTSLAKYNNQLIMTDDSKLYAYSQDSSKWITQGDFRPFTPDYRTVHSSGKGVNSVRHAICGNLTAYVFTETNYNGANSGTILKIVESDTGTVIYTRFMNGISNVCAVSTGFYLVDQNAAHYFEATTKTFTTIGSGYFAAEGALISDGTNAYAAWPITNNIVIRKFTTFGILSTTTVPTPYTANVISLSLENNNATLRVCCAHNAVTQKPQTFARSTTNLSTVVHAIADLSASSAIVFSITSAVTTTVTTSLILYTTSSRDIVRVTATSAGTISATSVLYTDANLISDLLYLNQKLYISIKPSLVYTTLSGTPRQSGAEKQTFGATAYILESSDTTTWKIISSLDKELTIPYSMLGTPFTAKIQLLNTLTTNDSSTISLVNIAYESIPFISEVSSRDWVPCKITRQDIYPSTHTDLSKANVQNQLLYNGALPLLYDGTNVTEQGFVDRPQITNIEQTKSSIGTAFPDGTYRFYVVWSYRDNNGYIYRSAPSDAQYVQVDNTSSAPNFTTRIYVYSKPPQFTLKNQVDMEIYMTTPTGITYHDITNKYSEYQPASSRFYISNVNSANLTDIAAGELLYTSGGALDNDAISSSYHLATHKNRIFSINDDRKTISYSQLLEPGYPAFFSGFLTLDIPEAGGKLTGVGSLDNALIIFKENFIYAISGDGPNNLGQQNDFTTPQLITADTGCIDKNSIVNTPEGLLFNSAKGIYLLGRNFSIQYKGAPAENYNTNVTTAVMLPTTNEVRFVMADSVIVNYDYFSNRWSTHPRWDQLTPPVSFSDIVDMTVTEDSQLYHLVDNGRVYKYATNKNLAVSYTDDNGGVYIPITLTSAWISFAGLQGYQRLYKLMILATYKSPHKLKVSFAYDMSENYVDSVIIDSNTVTNTDFYNLEIRPKRQKCSMVKFKIEELPPDIGTYGEGLTISGLAMELGVKEGLNKTVNTHGAT